MTDHLGNTRITFDTQSGTAHQVQVDDYYPFGMDIVMEPLSVRKIIIFTIKRSYSNTIMARAIMTR